MNKKTKIIATSVLSIIMCSSMIAGATYALFTSESTTNIAITSGNVKVNAFAQNISGTSLNAVTEGGKLMTFTGVDENYSGNYEEQNADKQGNVVTFKNGGTAELFEDGNVELTNITPGDKVTFEIVVENYSNVAIQYRTLLTSSIDTTKQTESTTNLFEALEITIEPKTAATVDDGDTTTQATSFYKMSENTTNYSGVENYASKWYNTYKDSKVEKETSTLEVTLFLPLSAGNEYRNLAGNLEFKVEAVQGNAATSGEETFKGVEKQVVEENRSYTIVYGADGTESITLTSLTLKEGETEVTIDGYIDGIPVTSIGEGVFSKGYYQNDEGEWNIQRNTTLTKVTIPSTVTEIGDFAFARCVNLETIDLSDTNLKSIGQYAFEGNQKLESIDLSTVTSIADNAFRACSALKEVTLSDDLTEISSNAFAECKALVNINNSNSEENKVKIPAKVTSIGDNAFSGCTNLESVEIPKSVKTIGANAFAKGQNLKSVTFYGDSDSDSLTEIGAGAFSSCQCLSSITLPSTLQKIGNKAFAGTAITYINIPANVTEIGAKAFSASSLTEVKFDIDIKLTTISDETFFKCSKLATISIPESVTTLGTRCFGDCTALQYFEFKNVENIGEGAFFNSGLIGTSENSNGIVLSENIKSIGLGAFAITEENIKNSSITINYSGTKENWDNLFDVNKTTKSPSKDGISMSVYGVTYGYLLENYNLYGLESKEEAEKEIEEFYEYSKAVPDCPFWYSLQYFNTPTIYRVATIVVNYNDGTADGTDTIAYSWNSESGKYIVKEKVDTDVPKNAENV